MTKAALLKALEPFEDEDHLEIDGEAWSFTPTITRICGKSQVYMPYYCSLPPGHEGKCYCNCKRVDFDPDED